MFQYTRLISDDDEKILKDSILNIKDWIDKGIAGKISNSAGRLAKRRRKELIKLGQKQIPASDNDLAKNAFADPDYKNRLERDLAAASQ